jgi:tripartite-type tricarboxylate transporter receptor subunit TctC
MQTALSLKLHLKKIGFTINYLNAKDFGKKIAKDDKKIKKLMNKLGLAKK